ncbi:serine/arginine-rich splicing factor SR45-like [Papaver somniferum]|uniref:serine/arginine-rich splicing factor SR45-like n=1 Tax=Papaver somniferum TaxID=3469 RepID=UPI000E705D05|nr:serine/arginine-rich splicing factor SR45-like [Papaver somniferum]
MASTSETGRTLRNRTVTSNSMQEGVTGPRQENDRPPPPERPRAAARGMPTVEEEVDLGRDDDLTPLERIIPAQRMDDQIDGFTASDTEDDEESLIVHAQRRRARQQAEYQEALGREQERLRQVQLGREAASGIIPPPSIQIPPILLVPPPLTIAQPPAHLSHPNGHSSHESTDPTLLAILEGKRRQEVALRELQQRNLALEFENYQLRNQRSRSRGSSSRGKSGNQGRSGRLPPTAGPSNPGRSGKPPIPPPRGYGPPENSSNEEERPEEMRGRTAQQRPSSGS